jgi:hypothetical protein
MHRRPASFLRFWAVKRVDVNTLSSVTPPPRPAKGLDYGK